MPLPPSNIQVGGDRGLSTTRHGAPTPSAPLTTNDPTSCAPWDATPEFFVLSDYERLVAAVQTELGEAACATAWTAGAALKVEQALAEALGDTLPSPVRSSAHAAASAHA